MDKILSFSQEQTEVIFWFLRIYIMAQNIISDLWCFIIIMSALFYPAFKAYTFFLLNPFFDYFFGVWLTSACSWVLPITLFICPQPTGHFSAGGGGSIGGGAHPSLASSGLGSSLSSASLLGGGSGGGGGQNSMASLTSAAVSSNPSLSSMPQSGGLRWW